MATAICLSVEDPLEARGAAIVAHYAWPWMSTSRLGYLRPDATAPMQLHTSKSWTHAAHTVTSQECHDAVPLLNSVPLSF